MQPSVIKQRLQNAAVALQGDLFRDALDIAIMMGVEKGFFDATEIIKQVGRQHDRQEKSKNKETLYRAWRAFHDTFDNSDLPQTVDEMHKAYKKNMKSVTRGELDEAISLFKNLGFTDQGSELIANYVDIHRSVIFSIDDSADHFHPTIKDEEFRRALGAAVVMLPSKSVKSILIGMYENNNIPQEDMKTVCSASAEDLYELFRGLRGDELHPVVEASLSYRNVLNATESQKLLTKHAREALEKIGYESPANAFRVKKYGVEISRNA